ncbi:MAG: hypothetical protein ACTHLR_13410 [Rhizomicrobium sp.]
MRVRLFFASLAAIAALAASVSLAQAQAGARAIPTRDGLSLSTDTAPVLGDDGFLTSYADAPIFSAPGRAHAALHNAQISAPLTPTVSLNAAVDLDLQGRFDGYGSRAGDAFDGLFLSDTRTPYAGFTDGGNFVGATIALAGDLHLRVGRASLDTRNADYDAPVFSYLTQPRQQQDLVNLRTATTSIAGLDWDFASWGGLGLMASDTTEHHGLLGDVNSSAFSPDANTKALAMSARVGFGNGWVTTVSYSEGISQLDLRANGLSAGNDTLHSRAYGIAIAKHGLFADNDSLGLAVSRPIQVYSSGNSFGTPLDDYSHILGGTERVALANSAPETDFEMGYVTTFLDGAVALQANAAWQQNLAGQSGVNSLAVLSRAKINF